MYEEVVEGDVTVDVVVGVVVLLVLEYDEVVPFVDVGVDEEV